MKAESVIVPPAQHRWESIMLAGLIAALIAGTGLHAASFGRDEESQKLLDWQISAFSDLKDVDQAICNELRVAADEIYWLQYYNGYWPDDADFQEFWLAPFYRDLSWERNGRVQWALKDVVQEGEAQGLTLYHGSKGQVMGQGAYLLVINHVHAGNAQVNDSSVWWHPNPNVPAPHHSKIPSLVLEGWKQVIPYQGRDEVERLNAG